ncbi:xylulokinase [Nakamurella endophytica]|uniref:Carbohydrate kinase n=1 Tax=Nakamurella endophytica TaxID=1748367 RepID=A0A917SVE8_9ACTN|nr:FGGY family carbohydrate kinase [Nakamurella endophytica]GGL99499.1 carbohydrate kinase [Nakamurella endophytica]
MSRYVGIDVGTSSVKAVLVDARGTTVSAGRAEYPTLAPGPRLAEQDPEQWLDALARAVADLGPLRSGTGADDVAGIGVAGHTPTLVLADGDRRPTRSALTWQDSRAVDEAAELEQSLGVPEPVVGGTLPWSPAYLPAKLWWVARHDPDALARARWLLQPKDFVGYALTGVAATDVWSSKGLCRIDTGAPVDAVLAAGAGGVRLLPPRLDPWRALGTVDGRGAGRTGLPAGVPVAVGWTDALSGMVALGAFGGPTAFVHTGTSDIVGVSGAAPHPAGAVLHIPASYAPLPVTYGPTQTSGAALLWVAALLGRDVPDVLASAGTAAPEAVPLFLPYLDGERAPLWQPAVRGRFLDVSLATGPAELARAVLDGVALADRHVLETAGAGRGPVHVGGVSALDPAWVRARLDALGRPLVLHPGVDVAAAGAAVLAAAAATGAELGSVAAAMAGPTRTVEPAPAAVAAADRRFERYRAAAAAVLADAGGAA